MARIYIIGIMLIIMFLNIPEVRDTAVANIQLHKPKVQQTITGWGDKYTPALQSIIADLMKSSQTIVNGKVIDRVIDTPVDTEDDWSLSHGNSITANQFDAVLQDYGSPAVGLGAAVVSYADSKHIDAAYALYIFIHESTAGTNKSWAGMKPDGRTSHNPGNVICVDEYDCYNGFADLPDWETGFTLLIDLLVEYRDGSKKFYSGSKKHTTIDDAIRTWAPAHENDTEGYINELHNHVGAWRKANDNVVTIQAQAEQFAGNTVQVNPITANITKQGRIVEVVPGMEISAPFDMVDCNYWGFQAGCQHWGTDILVAADAPVRTPVDCTYLMTGNYSDPSHAGDYFMCTTYDGFEYYSGHLLNGVHMTPGDYVPAGTIVGYGCTCVGGPHTHIQLRDPNGNLTDFMKYFSDRV